MVSKRDIADALDAGVGGVSDSARNIYVSGQLGPDYGVNATGLDGCVFIAPFAVRLKKFIVRVKTVESADGTIDVKKMASGGTSASKMVTTLVPTTAGGLAAATNEELAIITADADLATGDICMIMGGATGELTGVAYTAMFERLI